MCGRFTRHYTWDEVHRALNLVPSRPASNLQPHYNVCPTDTVHAIVQRDADRDLKLMRWGLVPAWWSNPLKDMRAATFNARSETVAHKPMFKAAWAKKNRCIIPASGYYEWQTIGKEKQPWYFTAADGSPVLAIAGLWETWTDRQTMTPLLSCSMLITEPNAFVAEVHDRMPVLLTTEQIEPWLSGKSGADVLRPAPEALLQKWPVSKRINSSRAPDEDATLIDEIAGLTG